MSFMSFQGRIGRGKWWLSGLLQLLLIGVAIGYVAAVDAAEDPRTGWQGPVFFLIVLIIAWIGLCSNIKRYHDRGKSGFWVLISFIPLIGAIWMIIELGFLPGDDGDNAYGSPPGSGVVSIGSKGQPAELALAGNSKLARIDDAYLRDYAAKLAEKPAAKAKAAVAVRVAGSARPAFGKRG